MNFTLPPLGINILLATLSVIAAFSDIRARRIPNWLTLSGVIAGFGMNAFLYEGWPGLSLSLGGLAVGFGVYFVLYLLRAMGAGDVKMMAAVGAMVGFRDWIGIFLLTALIGGVAALALVTARGRFRKTVWNVGFILSEMKSGRPAWIGSEELDVRNPKAVGLPHGAVIATATFLFLGLSARFNH